MPPQVRVYVVSEEELPLDKLADLFPEYKAILPHSKNEIALTCNRTIQSRDEFRAEYERVAGVLAPVLDTETHLGCLYDDEEGRTKFQVELYNTPDTHSFHETDPPSYMDR